jgi:hypothetical protein
MGALTEDHVCPRPARFGRIIDALVTVVVGGLIGSVLVYGLVEHPAGALVLAAAALGAVLANAVRQSVRM